MSEKKPPKRPSNRGHPPDVVLDLDDHVTITGAMVAVFQRLPGASRQIYIALLRRRADKRYVPIIVTQLAAEAGVHRSTARRALTRLGSLGLAKQRIDHGQERWKLTETKEV